MARHSSQFNPDSLRLTLRRLVFEESGQSMTEYILMLAAVVMVIMKVRGLFQKQISALVDKVGGDIMNASGQE